MNRSEDIRMGLRWILSRPVETLLLVFGISLGIGATAAGIALAGRTAAEARKILSSTEYREIVVSVRADAADMDVPAVVQATTSNVILTASDLIAKNDAQDVQYAYVANMTGFRFGSSPAPGQVAAAAGTAASAQFAGPPAMGDGGPPPDFIGGPGDPNAGQTTTAEPTLDGPQPVIEEARGYEVSSEYFSSWNLAAASGSLFTEDDMKNNSPVIVLGSTLAKTLFEDGQSLGRQVLSRRQLYKIVGVLEPTGTDLDDVLFTPAAMPNLQGLGGDAARMFRGFATSLHFTVADSSRLVQAKAELESWFDSKLGAGSVVVTIPRAKAEAMQDRNSRLVTVILFLAVSALVIAAANVVNILSSRAMRKRRSVGILKALGATIGGVFRLFFLEAFLVGTAGAVVGAVLSVLMSMLMQKTMGFGATHAGLLAAGIVGASVIVTVLDLFPALQASRVSAAEAIRYE
jgi:putative ABC transport system permease protein